jgi:hypothetical protein
MSKFFTRERFGQPQVVAGLLLLIFLAQCVWLVAQKLQTRSMDSPEIYVFEEGLRLWHGQSMYLPELPMRATEGVIYDDNDEGGSSPSDWHKVNRYHSALYYLIASTPLLLWRGELQPESGRYWGWLAHAPFLFFGVMLGASLWYVARRLYGNAGGYFALVLYCFAPGLIRSSALWNAKPETGAAWGAFGSIFTAIAVSHTLYAPQEVVIWNWRRIVLLGISLALAVGSQFSLWILLPIVLGFLLYLAPERRGAAVVIWAAACGVAFLLLFGSYFFRIGPFWQAMKHGWLIGFSVRSLGMGAAYAERLGELGQLCPALMIAVPASLIAYLSWGRIRYFGNTVPLLMAALFLILAVATPHYPGWGFALLAVPFLFLFAAGVMADLMETRFRVLVQACCWGLLAAYGTWSLMELVAAART